MAPGRGQATLVRDDFTAPGIELGGPLRGRLPEGRGECVYDSTPYGVEFTSTAREQRLALLHFGLAPLESDTGVRWRLELLEPDCGTARPAETAALPSELIGEFACNSPFWRSRLTLRADGRYLESYELLLDGRWQVPPTDRVPCDPWGRATFSNGVLTLEDRPATCEELGDPINIPYSVRTLTLTDMDAKGFSVGNLICQRLAQ
jgi:hypothetical protein